MILFQTNCEETPVYRPINQCVALIIHICHITDISTPNIGQYGSDTDMYLTNEGILRRLNHSVLYPSIKGSFINIRPIGMYSLTSEHDVTFA